MKKMFYLIVLLVFIQAGILTAGELIKINFQIADAPVPEDYLPDTGQLFGDQGNCYTYGWSQDMSDQTRDRNDAAALDQISVCERLNITATHICNIWIVKQLCLAVFLNQRVEITTATLLQQILA